MLFLLLTLLPAIGGDPWWSDEVDLALERAGQAREAWEEVLGRVAPAHREGLAFLVEHMPSEDLRTLKPERILAEVELAYRTRSEVPWGAAIPEEVFRNAVLPYANVTEARDPWREEFAKRFAPLVAECRTPGEAAVVLNREIFPLLSVKYSTSRRAPDQGPHETMESGVASCTGLSILLCDACRAVGVPARLAGIASWPKQGGNHTWVEVWDQGDWHYIGAAEPAPLDQVWFSANAAGAIPGSRKNGIWAVSYARSAHTFPLAWAEEVDTVFAVEVTPRYLAASSPPAADRCRLMVTARMGERRVHRRLRCIAVDDETLFWIGSTRDERADTRDILTFEVPRGRSYRLQLAKGREWRDLKRVSVGPEQERLEVLVAIPSADDEGLLAAFEGWFRGDEKMRGGLGFTPQQRLRLLNEPSAVRRLAFQAWKKTAVRSEDRADVAARRVRWNGQESPYTLVSIGQRPAQGWPLVIALHGGGGVPKEVNDSQWRQMQIYYRPHPEAGGYKYLALRAPNDNWNGFYDDVICGLVRKLIRDMILYEEVDPNRVSLVGYSHGGYGAFVIGSKMPDRFASVHASASAPTDGETIAGNLRNLHFTFMCGDQDNAYGRIERCRAFARELERLRGKRSDIFPGGFSEQAGFGHGGLPDRDIVPSLLAERRTAAPSELTWQPTDSLIHDFYWLHVDEPAGSIQATVKDNVVHVEATDPVTVYLDERLVDFSKPVRFDLGDRSRESLLSPELEELCRTLEERGDPGLAFTFRIDL